MTPADFAQIVRQIASGLGFAQEPVILGGGHLGPFPWQNLPAEGAMANAGSMLHAYAEAGFGKLQLDTSMACVGNRTERSLDPALIAERSAQLCEIAEASFAHGSHLPVYVVGTNIPRPGGSQDNGPAAMHITSPQQIQTSLETIRLAFVRHALSEPWNRVLAAVVQPGVG